MNHPRIGNDQYPTEHGLIKALVDLVPDLLTQHSVFEPCAGDGRLLTELSAIAKQKQITLETSSADLLPTGAHLDFTGLDAASCEDWAGLPQRYDIVLSNPPFFVAPLVVALSLQHSKRFVAMLLRLTFLEPCKNRRAILRRYSDNLILVAPVSPRPKFRADCKGTDNTTVAWFVWDKEFSYQDLGVTPPFQPIVDWRD